MTESKENSGLLLIKQTSIDDEHLHPASPVKITSTADSKERLSSASPSHSSSKSNSSKPVTRTKSPSFFKMLVGRGLRKVSTHEVDESDKKGADAGSFSDLDTDEPITFSAMTDNQRQRINHIATLPRRRHQNKSNGDSLTRSINDDHHRTSSPEITSTSRTNEVFESVRDKHIDIGEDQTDYDDPGVTYPGIQQITSPTTGQSEYHSIGLEALEALHNQLQILVIQDGDSDMADTMHENVEESLRKQISELQQSVSELQTTEQNLRLSLKMAEHRAQEAETKLHHSSQRGLKMEENYYRLEKEYHILHHHYSILEKHLQKQAVLHQMQLSPNKKRPNSATHHKHNKSFDSSYSPLFGNHPVKRHNSSEFLSHHQRQKKKGSVDCSYATADINPCSTLPTRLHSGSLSHTETRV